jgi:predicted nucleic acid-binding protein
MKELDDPGTPAAVRGWQRQMPEWIVVREARFRPDPTLARLGPCEREAIQLASEEQADLLLIDDKLGMRLARRRGLAVTGTLGVLLQGARRGLVDLGVALDRLSTTDFRCTPKLLEQVKKGCEEGGSNPTDGSVPIRYE